MNWRAIWAVVRKDLRLVTQNKNVIASLTIMPLLFFVIMPGVLVYLSTGSGSVLGEMQSDLGEFFANMPPSLRAELQTYDTIGQQFTLLIAAYLFAPLFLMVPLMVSMTFGADSIAGEHERKTLEGLIYTPITDFELYVAKLLIAWIPALIVTFVGGTINAVVVNIAAWGQMGRVFFPNAAWLTMVLWLAPAIAALGLSAIILVSARAKTVQEAVQLGSLVVLPVVLLLIAQLAGVVYLSIEVILIVGVIAWLIVLALLWVGAKTFRRGELIARL